jgi:hypothetical protein
MNEIVKTYSLNETIQLADLFARSGYFTDATDVAKAVVKIKAGEALGIDPFTAMSGIYIVNGKPVIGSGIMAGLIKRSGRYNYRVIENTDEVCRIEFFENGKSIGFSKFTIEDARKAKITNKPTWTAYAGAMLYARAIAIGFRMFTPDLAFGSVYVEGEIVEDATPISNPPIATLQAPQHPSSRPLDRVKALDRIADLGGDTDLAATLTDEDLIQYGKNLAAERKAAETEVVKDNGLKTANRKEVTGIVKDYRFVKNNTVQFTIEDTDGNDVRCTLFSQRSAWHQVASVASGEPVWTVKPDSFLSVAGDIQTHEKYGDQLIVDEVVEIEGDEEFNP